MGWFLDWWREIGLVGQIMACAAIPTSILLMLQVILMLIGAGFGGDSDSFDSDGADAEFDGFDGDGPDVSFDGFDGDSADISFDGFDGSGIDAGIDGLDGSGAVFGAHGYDGTADLDSDGFHGGGAYHGYGSGDDMDADVSHGSSIHKFSGTRMFTVRGIIAFFAIGGWAGLAALSAGIPVIWSIQISLLAGVAAMILSYVVIKFAMRMQSSGNIDLRNALSQTAEVYITIPASRTNTGKVMMLLQERLVEIEAMTDDTEPIKPHTRVEVIGLKDDDCLIVRTAASLE